MSEMFDKSQMSKTIDVPAGCPRYPTPDTQKGHRTRDTPPPEQNDRQTPVKTPTGGKNCGTRITVVLTLIDLCLFTKVQQLYYTQFRM